MKFKFTILSILLLVLSCDSVPTDEAEDTVDEVVNTIFGLAGTAVESLPHVTGTITIAGANQGIPYRGRNTSMALVTTGNISDYTTLANFFKLECFMPGGDDYCPAGTDTTGGDSSPYKFTSYTLIGSIYHADMYSGGLKTSCGGTSGTVTTSSFSAAQTGGDPLKFVLDYNSLLTCVSEDTDSSVGTGKVYHAYSVDTSETYQATLTTRYRVPYNGVSVPGQNDVIQVYVGLNTDQTPKFLAFNYAGADTMLQRTILLVNPSTHKFAVKHFDGSGNYLVAIGVGGADIATGAMNPGYYYTKFTNNLGTPDDGCVDNTTGNFAVDTTPCSTASIPITWTSSSSIATYLGMTTADQTSLAVFLAKFADDLPLTAADTPADNTTDPEINFPYSIIP